MGSPEANQAFNQFMSLKYFTYLSKEWIAKT